MIPWSFSRLDMYEGCPLLFLHTHILKTIPFVQNEAMIRGERIHKQIERNVTRAVHKKDQVGSPAALAVKDMVQAFVDTYSVIRVEEELAFTQQLEPTTWFGKDVWLRVKMDLFGTVYLDSDFQVGANLDWKTGQYRPSTDQLKLYNMASLLNWEHVDKVSAALVFVDQKKTSPILTTERWEVQSLIDEFADRSEAIQIANKRGDWPAQKNYRCQWCKVEDCRFVGMRG